MAEGMTVLGLMMTGSNQKSVSAGFLSKMRTSLGGFSFSFSSPLLSQISDTTTKSSTSFSIGVALTVAGFLTNRWMTPSLSSEISSINPWSSSFSPSPKSS
uniref:Uncharacterized protein n=1 Tax=Opuntia streptacantha TaxID=393608 RepID=A0A7C9DBN6_OPUST